MLNEAMQLLQNVANQLVSYLDESYAESSIDLSAMSAFLTPPSAASTPALSNKRNFNSLDNEDSENSMNALKTSYNNSGKPKYFTATKESTRKRTKACKFNFCSIVGTIRSVHLKPSSVNLESGSVPSLVMALIMPSGIIKTFTVFFDEQKKFSSVHEILINAGVEVESENIVGLEIDCNQAGFKIAYIFKLGESIRTEEMPQMIQAAEIADAALHKQEMADKYEQWKVSY